jgi:alkylation response protein AidB-like acyl-CoA dehydrogenase
VGESESSRYALGGMDFRLTPEHELIRESAYEFGQAEIVPYVTERDRDAKSDRGMLDKMATAGLLGVGIPEAYGGSGTDYISLGLVCEELERADTSARVVISVHSGLHSLTLLQWGTEEQKQRWLPALASGEKVGAFGLTEPNAGSDAINITTRARRDGDSYVLNGEKTWISLADYADQFLVIAKLEGNDEQPSMPPSSSSGIWRAFIPSRCTESSGCEPGIPARSLWTGSSFRRPIDWETTATDSRSRCRRSITAGIPSHRGRLGLSRPASTRAIATFENGRWEERRSGVSSLCSR